MKLNARQIETAKPKDKAYELADSGGLYLEITPRGSKFSGANERYHRKTLSEDVRAVGSWHFGSV
ncbi:hypothetical protein Phpb_04446 [Photorhabdus namnaonensis]|uniref:Integrase n=1 Tax=Photorhabdus namnaonensis TaxID=1851568 RepID=A0A1B8YBZ6_9GAMM|nr:hypothetical protein Phpb_04446 [Photorhabdus namnaonensis]